MREYSNVIVYFIALLMLSSVSQAEKEVVDWESKIHPKNRGLLNDVTILFIDETNRDVIWDLEDHPDRADVILLSIHVSSIPSAMQNILRTWVKSGKGIVCSAVTKCHTIFLDIKMEEISYRWDTPSPLGELKPASLDHPVLSGIEKIGASPARSKGSSTHYYYVFQREREQSYMPILEDNQARVVSFAMDFGGGRILVFPGGPVAPRGTFTNTVFDIHSHGYIMKYDGALFYLNAMLWLRAREVPRS